MGYIFEIKADSLINHHDKAIIGKEISRGLLEWYRGGYPDHNKQQGPPYLDETKLKEDELENLRRW